jgi:hypothetical protein
MANLHTTTGHYAPDIMVEPRHIKAEYDFQLKERRATCRALLTLVSNTDTARYERARVCCSSSSPCVVSSSPLRVTNAQRLRGRLLALP